MNKRVLIVVCVLWLLPCFALAATDVVVEPTISADASADSANEFDFALSAFVGALMQNVDWETCYVKSFDGSKQGLCLTAKRLVHSWSIGSVDIPLYVNGFGTTGKDNMLGGGLSTSADKIMSIGDLEVGCGICYLAGYEWSYFVTVSL